MRITILGLLVFVVSCTTTVQPPLKPTPAEDPSIMASQEVCQDLDAKGGGFYNTVVIPLMSGPGPSGRKSIDVDMVAMSHAVAILVDIGGSSRGRASQPIRANAEQTVRAAEAFELYAHADATSLLTAFAGLAVECTMAGHKPTWFDPDLLTG